jgi:hypothetical protein
MKYLAIATFFILSLTASATTLYLRPELGVSPISSAEDVQYSGFQSALNLGLNIDFLFSEIGIKHSSTTADDDSKFSTTAFHATIGLRPDEQFRFGLNLYPIISSTYEPNENEFSGDGLGLSMGWTPYPNIYLNGEYRFYKIENDFNEQDTYSFNEFIFSISYLFY